MRRLREAGGITCEQAGYAIRGSHSKISRMERGLTGVKQRDVADLLTLYGVSEPAERDNLLALAGQASEHGWLREYADLLASPDGARLELEQSASVIRCYENQFIPGLLQTEDYGRALARRLHPEAGSAELSRRAELLRRRQRVLHRPGPAQVSAIIDEATLRRRPGSATMMRRQLRQLIELAALPNVTIQVMPFSTGATAGGAVTLLHFAEPEVPDVVYLDQFAGARHVGRQGEVRHYAAILDELRGQAERPASTPTFLRRLIKET